MSEILSFVDSLWESNPRKPAAADRNPDEPDPGNRIISQEVQRPLVHGARLWGDEEFRKSLQTNEIFSHKAPVRINTPSVGPRGRRGFRFAWARACRGIFSPDRMRSTWSNGRGVAYSTRLPHCTADLDRARVCACVCVRADVPRRLTPPFPSLPATLRCSSQ